MKIIVEPEVISFTSVNEKSSFVVHVTGGQGILRTNYSKASSSLVWSDGSPSVRSPVFVYALSNSSMVKMLF